MALRADDTVGIVIAVHEGEWPKDWDVDDINNRMYVSRRVDVLWPDGVENSLPEKKLMLLEKKVIKSESLK